VKLTSHLRANNAGVLAVGLQFGAINIPPRQSLYHLQATCPYGEEGRQMVDLFGDTQEEIHVYQYGLHQVNPNPNPNP
jgi:hypothetical protein